MHVFRAGAIQVVYEVVSKLEHRPVSQYSLCRKNALLRTQEQPPTALKTMYTQPKYGVN